MIVLEGLDGAGKGTQTRVLSEAFRDRGLTVGSFEFPDYTTPVGNRIHHMLRKGRPPVRLLHTLLAENRRERLSDIKDALSRYDIVIMDRYYHSNMAYGVVNGMDPVWLAGLDADMPKPDVIVLLDIPAELSLQRKSMHDSFESDVSFLRMVADEYRREAVKSGWCIIDGSLPTVVVHQNIMSAIDQA